MVPILPLMILMGSHLARVFYRVLVKQLGMLSMERLMASLGRLVSQQRLR